MRVAKVMTRRVWSLRDRDSVQLASAVLRFWSFRHLPILDSQDRVAGMLTPSDLLGVASRSGNHRGVAISEVMQRPVVTIREDETLDAAAELMKRERIHALPVVGPGDRLVGIVTDVDVLAAQTGARPEPRPFERVPVDEVMTRSPVTVNDDATLGDAAEALQQGGIRHLPVVDGEGRLVGMLSERDLRARLGVDVDGFPDATLEALTELVSEAMTPDPISIRTGTPLGDVLETFAVERVGALPVVDDADKLVGILSYVDLLTWLRDHAERTRE